VRQLLTGRDTAADKANKGDTRSHAPHKCNTISGVAAVYQRHEFLAERKDALDRWGAHVDQIVKHS
jgi:hypothetical protein